MANIVNYAINFLKQLVQKYSTGLKTADLTTNKVQFINANTIKIPYIKVKGYKDHSRGKGWNTQDLENKFMTKVLEFDRDVEFFVDEMDVDESNEALTAANVTNVFLEEQSIPETDVYRISKLYTEWVGLGNTPDHTVVTATNALSIFDKYMEDMDDAGVPEEGRILYLTPAMHTLLKQAEGISRSLSVTANNNTIDRRVKSLEDVKIVQIPSARMKTAYDFSDGWKPAPGAKQINMILVHPRSVIACEKHSYIKLWPEGTHTQGDGWLYQNRKYGDLFVIDNRTEGIKINAQQ